MIRAQADTDLESGFGISA